MKMSLIVVVLWFAFLLPSVMQSAALDKDREVLRLSENNEYKYSNALTKALLFFEGQRSGKLPSKQRVQWRGDSALSDGKLENVNLTGGYYDAGDNVKFVWPMSFSMSLLSWAALEYKAQISAAGQLGHLHSAIKWGTDFILKCHTSPTTLYTQVGDGNSDHQCWERPEDMDTPRTLYKITSSSPGTEAAADAAAALASASIVFKDTKPTYSSRLLKKSQSLFQFANNYRGSYQASCPFYCSYSGYQDELLWAAAWLYLATNGTQYLTFLSNNQGWSQAATEFSWDNKYVGAQVLLTKVHGAGNEKLAKFRNHAESFICSVMPGSGSVKIQITKGGLLYFRDSANIQYVTTASLALLSLAKTLQASGINQVRCSSAKFSTSQVQNFAKSQVDYVLGKNPLNYSYMVGYGNNYPKQVHHRGASIPSIKVHPAKVGCSEGMSIWFPANAPNPNTHVGAVVGGPDYNDQFRDVRSDSNHLEPTTYMNAAFVAASAALLSESESLLHPAN